MERDTTHDVVRVFGVDCVYFDVTFLSLFLFLLIKNKKVGALWSFLAGALLVFVLDFGIAFNLMGLRKVFLPDSFLPFISSEYVRITIFLFWLDCTFGIAFSYVYIMFEKKTPALNKLLWALLVFIGWTSVAVLSQKLPVQDDEIKIIREMEDVRNQQYAFLVFYILLLLFLRYNWMKIIYVLIVGCSTNFFFEFSLWVSGIRQSGIYILILNAVLEGNTTIIPVFLVIDNFFMKEPKKVKN